MSAADGAERSRARVQFNRLYSQRTKFIKEDRTGFVWLYLQK